MSLSSQVKYFTQPRAIDFLLAGTVNFHAPKTLQSMIVFGIQRGVILCLAGILALLIQAGSLWAQNPTYMSASPSSLTMPGSITFCVGIPNISVDLRYWYNGNLLEADGLYFSGNGCLTNYYNYDGYAGTYTFTGIRNSANGPNGAFNSINTVVTLYPASQQPTIDYFYANPSGVIRAGQCTSLFWSSSNAVYGYINGDYVGASGSIDVCPISTTQYTLTVYNSAWQPASRTIMVTVSRVIDDATMDYQSVSTSMVPGNSYPVHIYMFNTGTTTWSPSQGYRLCSQNPSMNTTWGIQCVNLASNETIPPGTEKHFSFNVTAPSTPGTYNFQWQMRRNSNQWFGSPTDNLLVGDVPPQPTSMAFSPNVMNAGNGSYVLTVGNGANMYIDFQYTLNAPNNHWCDPALLMQATHWGPLDSSGTKTVAVNHNDAQGTYRFCYVKNSSVTDWVTLSTIPTFNLLGPEPYANTLTINPNPVHPPGSVTVTAGNAGGISVDARFTLDGSGPNYEIPWLSLGTAADGTTGTGTVSTKTCRPKGNYVYTGLRNSSLSGDPWMAENTANTTACPPPPTMTSASAPSQQSGHFLVTLYGTNLCGISQIISGQGINFSNLQPAYDDSGTSLTAYVDQNIAVDPNQVTLVSPCAALVDKAQLVTQNVPSTMAPGQQPQTSITFLNTGNTTWTAAAGYQLGSQNPANNTTWGQASVPFPSGTSTPPGGSVMFTFNPTAPATPRQYNFQWQMKKGSTFFGDPSQDVVVTVTQGPAITSSNAATFVVGTAGTFTVTATGSPTPTLSETGTLPNGVTFNASTGVLSGTPTAGTGRVFSITFTASNGTPPNATQNFTLTVNEAPAFTSVNAAVFNVGATGTFTFGASGYPASTFSESGSLPSGVTFTGTTGVLSGTPASGSQGNYPLTITASNGILPNATQNFTLTVNPAQSALSKEYVYLGGRLLAIEEAGTSQGKRSQSDSPQIRTASFSDEGGTVRLIIIGLNFTLHSQVTLNDGAVATTFVDAAHLRASFTSQALASDSTLKIVVINPSNEGGMSNTVTVSAHVPES